MSVGKIQSQWAAFIRKVSVYLSQNTQGAEIDQPSLRISPIDIKGCVTISFERPLRFNRLPMKQSSSKRMDVYLDGEYIFRFQNNRLILTKCTTYIAYYCHKGMEYLSYDGYHFDMNEVLQVSHPVFHAQRCRNILRDKISESFYDVSEGLTTQIDNDKEIPNIRLPTPCMDLFSAVIMILADTTVKNIKSCQDGFFELLDISVKHNPIKVEYAQLAKFDKCFEYNEVKLGHWYDKVVI